MKEMIHPIIAFQVVPIVQTYVLLYIEGGFPFHYKLQMWGTTYDIGSKRGTSRGEGLKLNPTDCNNK